MSLKIFLKLIRTLVTYILFVLLLLVFFIPCLIIIFLPERWRYDNKFFFWMADIIYKVTLWLIFVPLEVVGKENITKTPAIIAANHQSALDIPLVGALLGGYPHLWMAWSALTKYWIGPVISRMAVLVDTSGPMAAMKSLLKAIEMFKDKDRHVIIFPEGSRSAGNQVADFFAGFVILAKKTGRPVIPVLILNAYEVYPPGAFFINWVPMKVVVGKPILYANFGSDDEFKNFVRNWFVDNVNEFESKK
jgi:1-acyl-sn-glycerol-3-phosphate acyltransferase